MSDAPSAARAVVIGCGIVGNSLAYHLTRLGWTDIVLLDKGPLPNPGGSTGHASNFIFLVDHSKEMTQLTLESVRQYREMDVFTECGGIEVARTEERMEELRRRMASAKAWGIEPVSLVTPAEIKELVPYIDESILLGGFYTPGVGVVDSLQAGTIMREQGIESGGLTVLPNTEVHALGVEGGRIRRVETSKGTIEAETVVVACGVWSPLLAAHGRRAHPARADGAPDDRRRPRAAVREELARDRVPDRARHGRLHVRAPGRRRASRSARTRTARSSTTPRRSRRSRPRRSRRPSSRSPRPTSTRRWSMRST